jgi:hypothetical protein
MSVENEIIEEELVEQEAGEEEVVEEETDTEDLETEEAESEEVQEESEEESEEPDDDEIIVTIGDEEPEEGEKHNPSLVKHLRKQIRERNKELAELRKQNAVKPTEDKPVVIGEKPTLVGSDYDTAKFEKDLAEWYERKRQADAQAAKIEKEKEAALAEHQQRLSSYAKSKTELKVRDFDDAESVVVDRLDMTQQEIILRGADNPAIVVYALGKNEKKAKELAAIKDPIKFTFAVAKLEAQVKMRKRTEKPAPEKKLRSGNTSGVVDSKLKSLEEEADRTGDRTKVVRYKRELRNKNRS